MDKHEIGHCKDCKHWRCFCYQRDPNEPSGRCISEKFTQDDKAPSHFDGIRTDKPYMTGFETGAEFGCIHFVEKASR